MKAKEVKGKLFELTNEDKEFIYSLQPLIGNRKIKKDKVNKIVRAISEKLYIPTIIVDEDTLQVVEGNHRVAAMKECIVKNIPFKIRLELDHFDNPLEAARLLNNTGSKWAKNEKLFSFCTEGRQSYLKLRTLMDKHPLLCKNVHQDVGECNYNITPTLNCIAMGRASTTMDSTFSSGTLFINDEHLLYAEKVMNELEEIQKKVPNTCIFRKESVIAWCRFRESLSDISKFVDAFDKKSKNWQEPAQRIGDWFSAFCEIAIGINCTKVTC